MKSKSDDPRNDFAKIKKFSKLLEKNLAKHSQNEEKKIEKLSFDELQDFDQLLQIANFTLCKYENKKEVYSLLKDFVDMIYNSIHSVENIDDEIKELAISAESAISQIKQIQNDISEDFNTKSIREKKPNSSTKSSEKSANNLTKSTTRVYTQGYQPKSQLDTEQVI